MNRVLFRSCLGLLAACAGCATPGTKTEADSKPPEDPTAWATPALAHEAPDGSGSSSTRGGGSVGGGGGGFFKSTRLRGAMSSEGADIEKSLGVN